MRTRVVGGTEISALAGENLTMTWTARSAATPRLRRVLVAPCTRRAWAELGYAIVSFPVVIAGFLAAVVPFVHVVLLFVARPTVRWFGSVNRRVLHRLLGEQVQAPPPMRLDPHLHVTTTEPTRLTGLVSAAGGEVRRQMSCSYWPVSPQCSPLRGSPQRSSRLTGR
jgi:hypothetical protein